jgi:hypothetical protein
MHAALTDDRLHDAAPGRGLSRPAAPRLDGSPVGGDRGTRNRSPAIRECPPRSRVAIRLHGGGQLQNRPEGSRTGRAGKGSRSPGTDEHERAHTGRQARAWRASGRTQEVRVRSIANVVGRTRCRLRWRSLMKRANAAAALTVSLVAVVAACSPAATPVPTLAPIPSVAPSVAPTTSAAPSVSPSRAAPSVAPSVAPSAAPSAS